LFKIGDLLFESGLDLLVRFDLVGEGEHLGLVIEQLLAFVDEVFLDLGQALL